MKINFFKKRGANLLSFFFIMINITVFSQTAVSQTFNVGDPTTFQVPAGVTSITVEAWGAGGGGGGGISSFPSGGGGGGGYIKNSFTVIPLDSYTVNVGQGGVGTTSPGGTGGNSSIALGSTIKLQASGGAGGTIYTFGIGGASGAGGVGGLASAGIPTSGTSGGRGGNPQNALTNGSGGGGSAGTGGDGGVGNDVFYGGAAGSGTGGNAGSLGGNGGYVSNSAGTSFPGSPGAKGSGGGGRSSAKNFTTNDVGGKGGDGKVIISYFPLSDLSISQSLNRVTAAKGNYVIFTLVAKNNGPADNTNVSVLDLLPSGYTYANSTQSFGTYDSGTGVWTIGNLINGASQTLSINATVNTTGSYSNTAVISTTSAIGDPNIADNTSTTPVGYVCNQQVQGLDFTAQNGVAQTFSQPATNYGFVFDIYKLDNSFNMTINGVKLATSEIQFQTANTPAPGINIQFTDGDNYVTNTPDIYSFTGSAATPMLRVVISPTGGVSMFGSKVTNGVMFPLRLFNGNSFNTITWNTASTNTVIINQSVVGTTYITGRGYGLNIVSCPCYNPANTGSPGVNTQQGITLLQRAGATGDNWPMVRKSAFTVLESNTKGFVITRATTIQVNAIVSPQEGMMVYDTDLQCLKLYDGSTWSCFNTPSCN